MLSTQHLQLRRCFLLSPASNSPMWITPSAVHARCCDQQGSPGGSMSCHAGSQSRWAVDQLRGCCSTECSCCSAEDKQLVAGLGCHAAVSWLPFSADLAVTLCRFVLQQLRYFHKLVLINACSKNRAKRRKSAPWWAGGGGLIRTELHLVGVF